MISEHMENSVGLLANPVLMQETHQSLGTGSTDKRQYCPPKLLPFLNWYFGCCQYFVSQSLYRTKILRR